MTIRVFQKISLFLFLSISQAAFASETVLISCDSNALGAPIIQITQEHAPTHELIYSLVQKPLNPNAPATIWPLQNITDVQYADTRIITANHGRSGYAHAYVNRSGLSVLDVNLFGQMMIDAPNDYSCILGSAAD